MFKLVFICFLALLSYANEVSLMDGEIKAHTEVFGDSTIDPITKQIQVSLTKENAFESLRGSIKIQTLSLKSDNTKRDEHMYEALNAKTYPSIIFTIQTIKPLQNNSYAIEGVLKFNNVEKQISSIATLKEDKNSFTIKGSFEILLTQFHLSPPTLLFLSVRDQVDIVYSLDLQEI